jgi:hypothetical protein
MSGNCSECEGEFNRNENNNESAICYQCFTNKSPFKHLIPCPVIEAIKRLKINLEIQKK